MRNPSREKYHGRKRIIRHDASEEGWTEATQVDLLLRYIENQDSACAFSDFLAEQRADDLSRWDDPAADTFLSDVANALQDADLANRPEFQSFCANSFEAMTVVQTADLWRMREEN